MQKGATQDEPGAPNAEFSPMDTTLQAFRTVLIKGVREREKSDAATRRHGDAETRASAVKSAEPGRGEGAGISPTPCEQGMGHPAS